MNSPPLKPSYSGPDLSSRTAERQLVYRGYCGVVSVIAGMVVASTPVYSLNVLAVLLGIWFVIMGIFEIIAAPLLRHELRAAVLSLT